MPFLLTVRAVADDGRATPIRQARVTAYALKRPVVLQSDGSQVIHLPETQLTDETGHATLTLYRSSEVLTPSDWAVVIDGVTWSGTVPEDTNTAASILEMVQSYGWGLASGAQVNTVVAIAGLAGADGADGADGAGLPAGGTTGQVPVKASEADFDVAWGGTPLSLVIVTDDYTVLTTDHTILVAASGKTITLPDPSTVPADYEFRIKNTSAGDTTTVDTAAGTIDGAATYTGLAAAKAGASFVSDGVSDYAVL